MMEGILVLLKISLNVEETSLVAQTVKASAYSAGDLGSIPGLERSPGEGNGYPLQNYHLENSMDKETWWVAYVGLKRVGHD